MPVVHVRAIERDQAKVKGALSGIAESVARAADCSIGDVWCTYSSVTEMTIGTEAVDGTDQIVYIDVLMRNPTSAAVEAAAHAAASQLGVPLQDIWARLIEVRSGEVFAGGRLL